jgi:thioredoxin 2
MSDPVHVVCAQCLRTNRVPAARLAQRPRCGKCRAELLGGAPVALNETTFSKVVECTEVPVVVNFSADRASAPAFESAAREMRTRAKFAQVNAQQSRLISRRCRVRALPTVILFRDGREVDRMSGPLDAGLLMRWVQSQDAGAAIPKSP